MKYKHRTQIPKYILFAMLAVMLVGIIALIIVSGAKETVHGTITGIRKISDDDGISYVASASGVYNGTRYQFTKSVSKKARVGDAITGRVFVDQRNRELYNRWSSHTFSAGFLSIPFAIWLLIAYTRILREKRQRLDAMRSVAENSAGSLSTTKETGDAFKKPESSVEHAVQLVAQRGLTTREVASQLSEEDWEMPEMKATVLRPDIKVLESTAISDAKTRLDRALENFHMEHSKLEASVNSKRAKKGKPIPEKPFWTFAYQIPVPSAMQERIVWSSYSIGTDNDQSVIEITLSGKLSASYYEFNCTYKYPASLPVDLQIPPEVGAPINIKENIFIPSND